MLYQMLKHWCQFKKAAKQMLEICCVNDNLCSLSWPAGALKICIHLLSLNIHTPKKQQQFKVAPS